MGQQTDPYAEFQKPLQQAAPADPYAAFQQPATRPAPPAPAPAPAGNTLQAAPAPSMWDRLKGTVANSAIGTSLEQQLPYVADKLGLHPTETVNSPTYQSDRNQVVAPQYLAPGNPQSVAGNIGKGALRGIGQLTTGKNLAIGAGVAATGGMAAPLAEGTGTLAGVAKLGMKLAPRAATAMGMHGVFQDGKQAVQQYQSGDKLGAADSFGAALPNAALTLPALGRPIERLGSASQDAGVGLINETVGARSKDFARGASPGQGYFQAGFGPSASMRSIADKARGSLTTTGQAIGDATNTYQDSGGLIPFDEGAAPIHAAIQRARTSLTGPGGTGDSSALDNFAGTWQPLLDAAEQRGGFLPSEYAQAKRNTADNTTWGDPSQAGMKQVRQQTVGGMGGQLTSAIPALRPLNSQYQNLYKLADRAEDRATTGSMSLKGLGIKAAMTGIGASAGAVTHNPYVAAASALGGAALDSVPVRTSVASSLYYGGKGLAAAGGKLSTLLPRFGEMPTQEESSDYREADAKDYGSGQSEESHDHANPSAAPYALRNLTPEILNPDRMSRSKFGVGANGRGGTLIRPLGALPAPLDVPPQATPYSSIRPLVSAIPARSPQMLESSIGTAAHRIPARLLGNILTPGTSEEQQAALRKANLGSLGNTVPSRIFGTSNQAPPTDASSLFGPKRKR